MDLEEENLLKINPKATPHNTRQFSQTLRSVKNPGSGEPETYQQMLKAGDDDTAAAEGEDDLTRAPGQNRIFVPQQGRFKPQQLPADTPELKLTPTDMEGIYSNYLGVPMRNTVDGAPPVHNISFLPVPDITALTEDELMNHQHEIDPATGKEKEGFSHRALSIKRRETYNKLRASEAAFVNAGLDIQGYRDYNRRQRKQILDAEVTYLKAHPEDPGYADLPALEQKASDLGKKLDDAFHVTPHQRTEKRKIGEKLEIKVYGVDGDRLDSRDVQIFKREEHTNKTNERLFREAKANTYRISRAKKEQEEYKEKMRAYYEDQRATEEK
jgi:hypothetical protein